MSQRRVHWLMLTVLIVGLVLGVTFSQLYFAVFQSSKSPQILSLELMYQIAIEDAIVAKPSEIYSGLTPVVESNTNLTWRGDPGNQSVLVVTFTRYTSSYPMGETVNCSWGETWVTVVPEIQTFFKNNVNADANTTLRALQLLGLPPGNINTYFVELWVSPHSLFRPSADNHIDDTVAQLAFPESATDEYREWFNDNIIYSYFPQRYPWTRLGYTYDWASTGSHVGLSEFVIKQNSLVEVKSVTPTMEYLQP